MKPEHQQRRRAGSGAGVGEVIGEGKSRRDCRVLTPPIARRLARSTNPSRTREEKRAKIAAHANEMIM